MTDGLRTCNYIKKSKIPNAEWGVFAGKNFKKGDIVEKNIFIEFLLFPSSEEYKLLYFYFWKYQYNEPLCSLLKCRRLSF
jgi:hypothetical protein